jgi:hypothetical protein
MIIAYYCCRGSTEEPQNSVGEGWNLRAHMSRAVEFVSQCKRTVLGGWLGPRPVAQCSYLDVDQNIESHTIIFKKIVRRGTMAPYEFKFDDPSHIITGIACVPQDDKTSSPETQVVDGGIGFHHVVIRLSPVEKGTWASFIEISGVEDNSVHVT